MPILTLREIGDQGWGSVEVCDDAPGVEALARDSIQYLLMDLLLTHLPQLYQRGDDLVLVPEKRGQAWRVQMVPFLPDFRGSSHDSFRSMTVRPVCLPLVQADHSVLRETRPSFPQA